MVEKNAPEGEVASKRKNARGLVISGQWEEQCHDVGVSESKEAVVSSRKICLIIGVRGLK